MTELKYDANETKNFHKLNNWCKLSFVKLIKYIDDSKRVKNEEIFIFELEVTLKMKELKEKSCLNRRRFS